MRLYHTLTRFWLNRKPGGYHQRNLYRITFCKVFQSPRFVRFEQYEKYLHDSVLNIVLRVLEDYEHSARFTVKRALWCRTYVALHCLSGVDAD
jgi:hypothetical protein